MSHSTIAESLQDVAFTTTTPFHEDGDRVFYSKHEENLRSLEDSGAELFIPCGNTGEYYSLTDDERISIVRTTVEAVGNDATVIAGAGGSIKETLALAEEYEAAGADALMVMYPSHTYVHQSAAVEYYRRIADVADLPVVLYKRGPALSDDALLELSTVENIVGVKYAVNDIAAFSRVVSEAPGDTVWVNGIAERFAPSFALEGASGFTTGIGNALPEATLTLFDAIKEGNWDAARRLRDAMRPLEDLREQPGENNSLSAANNVPVVKNCMESVGMFGGPVREPLTELSQSDRDKAREYVDHVLDVTRQLSVGGS